MTDSKPSGKWKLAGQWLMIALFIGGSWMALDRRVTQAETIIEERFSAIEDKFTASEKLTQERFNQRMMGYMAVINTFKDQFDKIDDRVGRVETRLDKLVDNH